MWAGGLRCRLSSAQKCYRIGRNFGESVTDNFRISHRKIFGWWHERGIYSLQPMNDGYKLKKFAMSKHRIAGVTTFTTCALFLAVVMSAAAEDGVSAAKIVFGQAAVLEGPASALGMGMRFGIKAAF